MRNGIKVWMLSSEDEIQMTVNCNSLKLLSSECDPIIINGETEREIEDQIQKGLSRSIDGKELIENKERLSYSLT
jgi:hypothetical protein